MDKKRALLNSLTSIGLRVVSVVLNFFALRALVHMLGIDYQGFTQLFNSIFGVLTIVEVGFAGAIAFCLYDPILKDDKEKVAAYYHYLRRIYVIIGIIILASGAVAGALLPFLSKGAEVTWDIYLSYAAYLLGTGCVYFFSAKGTLLAAYKENYKKDLASSLATIVQHILQIIFAYVHPNFLLFSSFSLVNLALQYVLLWAGTRNHKEIFRLSGTITPDEKKEIYKLIRGNLLHRISGIFANSLDTILISSVISVTALGHYSNYATISTALVNVLGTGISAMVSVIGHAYKSQGKEAFKRYFDIMSMGGFLLASVVFVGFAAASTPFVRLFYGEEFIEAWPLVLSLSAASFVNLYAWVGATFRDACGLFKEDMAVPVATAIAHLILKLSLVFAFGILGVTWANVIVYCLVSIPGTTYFLYKKVFQAKFDATCVLMLLMPFLFLGEASLSMYLSSLYSLTPIVQFIANGFIGIGVAALISGAFCISSAPTRKWAIGLVSRNLRRLHGAEKSRQD